MTGNSLTQGIQALSLKDLVNRGKIIRFQTLLLHYILGCGKQSLFDLFLHMSYNFILRLKQRVQNTLWHVAPSTPAHYKVCWILLREKQKSLS